MEVNAAAGNMLPCKSKENVRCCICTAMTYCVLELSAAYAVTKNVFHPTKCII